MNLNDKINKLTKMQLEQASSFACERIPVAFTFDRPLGTTYVDDHVASCLRSIHAEIVHSLECQGHVINPVVGQFLDALSVSATTNKHGNIRTILLYKWGHAFDYGHVSTSYPRGVPTVQLQSSFINGKISSNPIANVEMPLILVDVIEIDHDSQDD